ncbi:TetR/AcrR family transcriptional regulator [Chondromyces crocatus]|uniref:TetR family transcriptional regulator n=1 Tax=Chondromyces crocatus TaxID=52 RepID=A0A0K1ELD5_CHOCO|nr:TetR/AcrR family transcriptional regulator [Chondromyces crocatus]AKT41611.1 TetR family transcriptional regulator [Chondromyces crocatus]
MSDRTTDVRRKIVRAAAELLREGGREAVSTRAVSAAANVQAPTIYRHFGDMHALRLAAAREVLARYVAQKAARAPGADAVEDLRRGWDMHVAFGLANPAAYTLLYGLDAGEERGEGEGEEDREGEGAASAMRDGLAVLRALVERVAKAGRLRVSVPFAVQLIHAGGSGVTLALIETPAKERDLRLSEVMRESVLGAILVEGEASPSPRGEGIAARAIALQAALADGEEVLSKGERVLLEEWLVRLAGAGAGGGR